MKKIKKSKKSVLVVLVVLVAIGALLAYRLHLQSVSKVTSPKAQDDKQSAQSANGSKSQPHGNTVVATADPSHPQTTGTIAKPTGQVLNKNVISLSSGAPQTSPALNSTCQTVFEAKCGLQLTASDGTMKTVPAQSVDSNGAANIDWSAKAIGLTPGTWKVQLLASKGSASALGDSYNLTVNP